jgi:ankyrin repeat protein
MRPPGTTDDCQNIIRHLLEHGADVNRRGGLFGHPVTAAAYNMTPAIIGTLLSAGAKVDVKDDMGRSPVHLAALHGVDNLQAILDAGGDVTVTDATKRNALHWAVAAGRAKSVERILSRLFSSRSPDLSIDSPDIDGWTPLCWASRDPASYMLEDRAEEGEPADQVEVIRLLLQHGANRSVVAVTGDQKWTPLKIARFFHASEEVLKILEKGLDGAETAGEKNAGDAPKGDEYETKKGGETSGWCDFCLLVSIAWTL